jgi:quinol monooxygenase YgiN
MTSTTLHITLTLSASSLPDFYAALKTLNENLIKEPECLYQNAFELLGQPGVVRLVEIWSKEVEWITQVSSSQHA